jgi:hypothetical protein
MKRSRDLREGIANRQEQRKDAGTAEKEIDQIPADSFPASDPPPWTPGVTETPAKPIRKRKADRG